MSYTVPAGRYGDTSTAFIQAYIDQAIAGVIELAPETLNSLNELAAAINDDPAFYATVAAQVGELNTDVTALNAALGIAENDSDVGTFSSPTLPDSTTLRAVLEAFASAYDTTKSNLESADTALSGRIDTLEADPTTATALAAETARVDALIASGMWLYADQAAFPSAADNHGRVVHSHADGAQFYAHSGAWVKLANDAQITAVQADVDQNEADSDAAIAALQLDVNQNETDADAAIAAETTARTNADTALSGRLDTLEADPTTAAAVAAVQADVNQNESDADAAIALKLNTADPAATGELTVDTNAKLEFDSNLTKLHNVLRGTSIDIGNNIELKPAAAGGRVEITGDLILDASDLTDAADDTAAAAAGVIVGQIYHNSGALRIRLS